MAIRKFCEVNASCPVSRHGQSIRRLPTGFKQLGTRITQARRTSNETMIISIIISLCLPNLTLDLRHKTTASSCIPAQTINIDRVGSTSLLGTDVKGELFF